MSIFRSNNVETFITGEYTHYSRADEKEQLKAILMGDDSMWEGIQDSLHDYPLAKSAVRHEKNLLICFIAVVSRQAIDLGRNERYCYGASDYWINEVEASLAQHNVLDFYRRIMKDFRGAMPRERVRYGLTVKKAVQFINQHIHERVLLTEAAETCQVNPNYLSRLFHKEIGKTFRQYTTEVKMLAAKKVLMTSTRSVSEISEQFSISSPSYFIKLFTNIFGLSPQAYRKQFLS